MDKVCLSWDIDYGCCQALSALPTDPVEAQQLKDRAANAAHSFLDYETGFLYTQCDYTTRLCTACGCRRPSCDRCFPDTIDLYNYVAGPVASIVSIENTDSDGIASIVPPNSYALRSSRFLVPFSNAVPNVLNLFDQDLSIPYGAANRSTTQITLRTGLAPPAGLLLAANDLACQILSWCLHLPCAIPSNAISYATDRMTVQLRGGLDALTSIPTVEMALRSYGRKRQRVSKMIDPSKYQGVVNY